MSVNSYISRQYSAKHKQATGAPPFQYAMHLAKVSDAYNPTYGVEQLAASSRANETDALKRSIGTKGGPGHLLERGRRRNRDNALGRQLQ